VVDGKTWDIAATYYLRLPQGLQFTIEYPYRFNGAAERMNDEGALAIVFPLMKHAYTKGLYRRGAILKVGEGRLTPSRIGVTLFEKVNGNVHGYRVGLSLAQIRERIAQATAPDVPVPPKVTNHSP